jgi:hypothetical protein
VFECKIYIEPEMDRLNDANIAAHDKFVQTRFYASIMVMKLGASFGKDFEECKNLETGGEKTETGPGIPEQKGRGDGQQGREQQEIQKLFV